MPSHYKQASDEELRQLAAKGNLSANREIQRRELERAMAPQTQTPQVPPIPSKMPKGGHLTPSGDIGAMRGAEAKKLFPKVGGKHESAASYFKKNKVLQKSG